MFSMRLLVLLAGFVMFVQAHSQTVTDADGNVYQTVTIGTQEWMAENLKTTRYRDGSGIPMIIDSAAWGNAGHAGYCWYSGTPVYKDILGALYNGYAAGSGRLAPEGWHVPDDREWSILSAYLGGELVAGGKLKSVGTVEIGAGYWFTPNYGATNQSGFSGLGGGTREADGAFHYLFSHGYFWTSTSDSTGFAVFRQLSYNYGDLVSGYLKSQAGLSVRCIRDSEQSIEQHEFHGTLHITPNPVKDHMTITFTGMKWPEITIFDVFGARVLLIGKSGSPVTVDVRALSKGIYFVQVAGHGRSVYRKLIKE